MGKHWMVSTGHHLASTEAARVLEKGGNAVDAAMAASAVLTVVRPQFCGLGGDLFAQIYWSKSREVEVMNASGTSPYNAQRNKFQGKEIPKRGILAASVPGLVSGWSEMLKKFGTYQLADILSPAIALAEEGFPIYRNLAEALQSSAKMLVQEGNRVHAFFKDGRTLQTGELLVQSRMAKILREIAASGPDAFYRGEPAKAIVRESQARGGLFSDRDFFDHQSLWVPPVWTTFRDHEIYAVPPNSYGSLLLLQLKILEDFDLKNFGHNTADALHVQVEAKKLAFADGDYIIADPDFMKNDLTPFVSKAYATKQAKRIDLRKAAFGVEPGLGPERRGGSTTYIAVVDSQGNCVSLIQSLYHSFGCGVFVEDTGIALNNRMIGFTLQPDHPNEVAPHKRPAHTLSPSLLFKKGLPSHVLGTPGGTGQTQSLAQIIINLLVFGMDIQEAIEAARWRSETERELAIESRLPKSVADELKERGHDVRMVGSWSPSMGGAEGITIDIERGVLTAGADPRRDGYAIGY
jgi:gamma-glutamyltranspeptidase/glutathione hydrolase